MKIIADENMPALEETFAPGNELIRLNGRQMTPQDVEDADVLLVRSITRVDQALLDNSKVRFVGSATIGIDHLDTSWLDANNICWANAPGCNADAAAQFTLSMMVLSCERLNRNFLQQSVGVVGRGNVGSRLVKLLQSLGSKVVACDPPLQDAGQTGLVSMSECCEQDIVSIHVPLTSEGPNPTKHLFDQLQLAQLRPGTLLVNAARGGVVNAKALLHELNAQRLYAALDVWPDEPFIARQLLDATTVATPHVAGSSVQGKRNGTLMIYQAFRRAFPHLAAEATVSQQVPTVAGCLEFPDDIGLQSALKQLLEASCPVARDDEMLRALKSTTTEPNVHIDALRSHYPRRNEFAAWAFEGAAIEVAKPLQRLGFSSTATSI